MFNRRVSCHNKTQTFWSSLESRSHRSEQRRHVEEKSSSCFTGQRPADHCRHEELAEETLVGPKGNKLPHRQEAEDTSGEAFQNKTGHIDRVQVGFHSLIKIKERTHSIMYLNYNLLQFITFQNKKLNCLQTSVFIKQRITSHGNNHTQPQTVHGT